MKGGFKTILAILMAVNCTNSRKPLSKVQSGPQERLHKFLFSNICMDSQPLSSSEAVKIAHVVCTMMRAELERTLAEKVVFKVQNWKHLYCIESALCRRSDGVHVD